MKAKTIYISLFILAIIANINLFKGNFPEKTINFQYSFILFILDPICFLLLLIIILSNIKLKNNFMMIGASIGLISILSFLEYFTKSCNISYIILSFIIILYINKYKYSLFE